MDGTNSVRTKKVSSRTAKAMVKPSWRDWSEFPAVASTVKVPARIGPAEVMVPPVCLTARTSASRRGCSPIPLRRDAS